VLTLALWGEQATTTGPTPLLGFSRICQSEGFSTDDVLESRFTSLVVLAIWYLLTLRNVHSLTLINGYPYSGPARRCI